jgi:hypothetical protein
MTTIAKKISIGIINGVRAGFKNVKEPTHVARIYGRASASEPKDGGTMGISYKFTGDFVGVNADGEETMSPVCYLIAPADTLLVQALKDAQGAAVEFAFDFFVIPNPTAVLGYEYKVKPVIPVKKSEPLLALAAQFGEDNPGPQKKQLALPAAETSTEAQAAEMVAEGAPEAPAEQPPKHGKAKNHK